MQRFGTTGRPGLSLVQTPMLLAAFLISALCPAILRAEAPPAAISVAPRLSPAESAKQNAEVQKLLMQYRKPATPAEERARIVSQLLDLGAEGPRQLATQTARDFAVKGPAYLSKLERSSTEAVRGKWKGKADVGREVEALRKTILDISHAPDLTKEMIVKTSDPALEQLTAMMSITPDEVFTASPDLKAQRQELLDTLSAWHQAVDKLPEASRKKLTALPEVEAFDKELSADEELAATMATPMTPSDRSVLLANLGPAKLLDPEEAKGILAVNILRIKLGLSALAIDPKLCAAARGHSTDMRERKFFAHESPVPGKATPWDRAKLAGTSANAENIFMGSPSGESAVEAWWHSPGHHKNMTAAGHRRIGMGRSETHWTQMFGQ